MSMRELLLSADDRFFMTTDNKLNFKVSYPTMGSKIPS